MQPARVLRHMPIEHIEQCSGVDCCLHLWQGRRENGAGRRDKRRLALVQDPKQVADGIGLSHRRYIEPDGKSLFDPKDQFGPA